MLKPQVLLFPAIADIAVLSVDVDIEKVRLDAQCTTAGAACPGCGVWSTRVHRRRARGIDRPHGLTVGPGEADSGRPPSPSDAALMPPIESVSADRWPDFTTR